MRITKRQLKQIIREEKAKLIKESSREAAINFHRGEMDFGEDEHALMDLDDHNELLSQIERMIYEFKRKGYMQEDVVHAISEALGEFR